MLLLLVFAVTVCGSLRSDCSVVKSAWLRKLLWLGLGLRNSEMVED
jgi:hypothetical protein